MGTSVNIFAPPYFVYHDSEKQNHQSYYNLTTEQAHAFNGRGYAVGVYVNDLGGGRSDKDLVAIRAWFVDIDFKKSPKPELLEVLDKSPLLPSAVVSTASGYHL